MKKWIILVVCVLLTALCCAMTCAPVGLAESASDAETVPEAAESFADYFERVWLDKLLQYVSVLLGAISAVAVCVARVKKASASLDASNAKLGKRQEDLAATQRALCEAKDAYLSSAADMQRSLDDVLRRQQEILAAYQDNAHQTECLRQAVRIGFCNDPGLVENGYAKEIARLLEVPDDER